MKANTERKQIRWESPILSLRPDETAQDFKDAQVSPFNRRLLKDLPRPRSIISGAVYGADGVLEQSSQRACGFSGDAWVNDDPATADKVDIDWNNVELLPGRWIYGGHFFRHFGHFIVETLPNLWLSGDFEGVIFSPINGNEVVPWQRDLMNRITKLPVNFVPPTGAKIEHLFVPGRPTMLNYSVTSQAVDVWQKIAEKPTSKSHVFLSRSKLKNASRSVSNDAELDQLFHSLGFKVIYPELIPIHEQLHVIANADILAGVSGSQLHLSAFAPPNTKVIEVGDSRSKDRPLIMQKVIDGAYRRPSAFIPQLLDAQGKRDIVETSKYLEKLLLLSVH